MARPTWNEGLTWLAKMKLRACVLVVGVPLAVAGMILASVPPAWLTLPLVGVAVAAVTMTLNKVGQRLEQPTCWTCGRDLSNEPAAEHGVACPGCGSLNQFNPGALALGDAPDPSGPDDPDATDHAHA